MSDRSQQIDSILAAAVELLTPDERSEYIQTACGGDHELERQVQELVDAYLSAGNFLESPAAKLPPTIALSLPESAGTQIGPYKLLQQIGEGGMGAVFMAEQDKPMRRTVAVKIIKPGMDSRKVIARFEAERQALALMDHPNIAKVLDAGATETGRPYFVMELVKGVPVTEYCDEHQLNIEQRLRLFCEVCHAVQHAHQKGVIHRDLKPSNVLVAEYDDQPVPKVIDFGVAKAISQQLTERTLFTEFGLVIGTFEYMSPEQAKLNQLDVDTRSDIYSLGVLLYELMVGSTPLEKERIKRVAFDEILRIICKEEPPPPSTRLSSSQTLPSISARRHAEPGRLKKLVRGELDWIVMKCLEKDRSRRYESAGALADDVARYLSDEPVKARPSTQTYRLMKFFSRNKAGLVSAGLIAVALVIGTVVSTWQAVRATHAEQQAISERDEKEAARHEAEVNERRAKVVSEFLVEAFRSPSPKRDGRTVTIAEVLARAADEAETRFIDDRLTLGALLHATGESYRGLAIYDQAISTLGKACKLRIQTLGRQHPDTIRCVRDLGWAYIVNDESIKALPLFKENLRVASDAIGAKAPATLQCKHDLAVCYFELGRTRESIQIHQETFAAQEATLGRNHEDTIESMFEMARNYEQIGRTSEAAGLYQEVIDLADDHPQPLMGLIEMQAMEYLALSLGRNGEFDKAVALVNKAISRFEKLIGKEHKGTRHAQDSRASIYDAQIRRLIDSGDFKKGDADQALQLAERAIEVDPQPCRAFLNLGWAEYRVGHWQSSIDAFARSSELHAAGGGAEQWFGSAMAHWRLGHKEEAERWFARASQWMNENVSSDERLLRVRAEAGQLLGRQTAT